MLWHFLTAVLPMVAAAPAADTDEHLIQGTWIMVSREFNGKKTPEADLKKGKVLFKDGMMTGDDGKKKEKVGSYKLDPSKEPKAIDLTTD